MNTIKLHSTVLGLCLTASGYAQSYSIDWFTVDGGGGTSTGGPYALSGTLGQPDAGAPVTGGQYSLTGGFWSLLSVVQMPDAPKLTIRMTGPTAAVVSWPSPSSGFALEQSSSPNSPDWTTPPEPVNDDGIHKSIAVIPPVGNRFYRLVK